MRILYSIAIYLLGFVLKILSPINEKIRLGVNGRKESFRILESKLNSSKSKLWFHCSSLGEYEQGLPVFEAIINKLPHHQVVLSFFSPSGYEIKKDKSVGDIVVYLPLDTPKNAKRFLKLVNPDLIIYTKYDIWPNYLIELQELNSRAYLISALFRKNQSYFKWYGGLMRKALMSFDHIFTQNEASKSLLNSIDLSNVSVSGDTRFDRVSKQLTADNTVSFLERFTNGELTIVFGSSWPEDDDLFIPFINHYAKHSVKFLIAPHKISEKYTNNLLKKINKKVICYSHLNEYSDLDIEQGDVFILDTIGYLNRAYSYGTIAYVGGAAGPTGLHNILEPAIFGIPIIIGKNYNKFPEAIELIELGGVKSVNSDASLFKALEIMVSNSDERTRIGRINSDFVRSNSGAVQLITKHLFNSLD